MIPAPPSGWFALVFRGGDTTFLPSHEATQVMQAKTQGATTIVLQRPPRAPLVFDCASIERIHAVEEWIDAVQTKVQVQGARVCGFGTVHQRGEACRCFKAGKPPLTMQEVTLAHIRATKYIALPSAERAAYDDHDPSMRTLLETGYFDRIAKQLPLPATDNAKD